MSRTIDGAGAMREIIHSIRNIDDIKAIESVPLEERVTTGSTYELIRKGALQNPDAIALYFLLSGEMWERPIEVSYRDVDPRRGK